MEHIFHDAAGRAWSVIDYKVVNGKKKRVALGSWTADGRAFVPSGWDRPVMLRQFISAEYHTTEPKILQGQLNLAKASTATPAERMQRNSAEQ
jgi:hypothetical protein